jgi:hypothetical protein
MRRQQVTAGGDDKSLQAATTSHCRRRQQVTAGGDNKSLQAATTSHCRRRRQVTAGLPQPSTRSRRDFQYTGKPDCVIPAVNIRKIAKNGSETVIELVFSEDTDRAPVIKGTGK